MNLASLVNLLFSAGEKQHLAFWRGRSRVQVSARESSGSESFRVSVCTYSPNGGRSSHRPRDREPCTTHVSQRVHYQGSVMSSDRTPNPGPAGPDTATDRACRVCGPAVISPGMWIVVIPLMPRGPLATKHPIIGVVSVMCGDHGADPQESCAKSTPCSPRTLRSSAGPLTLPEEDNLPQVVDVIFSYRPGVGQTLFSL